MVCAEKDPTALLRQKKIEERNMRTLLRGVKAFNAQDFDRAILQFAPGYTWNSNTLTQPIVGLEATKRGLEEIFKVFPDVTYSPKTIMASGNYVQTIFAVKGHKVDGFMGLPPMNKPFEFMDSALNQFNEQGLRVMTWDFWDRAYLLRQLGVIPESFAGKKTIILGEVDSPPRAQAPPTVASLPESSPASASTEPNAMPDLASLIPPGVNPYTYRIKTVQRGLDQVIDFSIFSRTASVKPIQSGGQFIGAKVEQSLHRLRIRVGAPAKIGQITGQADLTWKIIPGDFVASQDSEPPPTPLDTTRSQRCILDGRFEFNDAERSGFYGFGTGCTWPSVNHNSPLLLGTIMEVREARGKFEGLTGTVVTNGCLKPSKKLVLETLLRVRDPSEGLRSTSALPPLQPLSGPGPETTSLLFAGDMNPANPVTFILGPQGQFLGANGHERLRLAEVEYATQGSNGLRSRTQRGPVVGEMEFKVYFDAFQKSSPIPFQTRYATLSFNDLSGTAIGTLDANIVEGRAFPTALSGAPLGVFQMASLAPVTAGTGIFEGAIGLVSVNVWLSILPRVIDSLVLIRLWDPKGRYRAAVGKSWPGSASRTVA